MTDKTIPDMKEIFRQAAEIAKQVPENMQVAAFNRALDLLTGVAEPSQGQGRPGATSAGTPPKVREAKTEAKRESPVTRLMSEIDTTQHPGVASSNKVLDRALMVLQIALRSHAVDGLTPPEIAQILTEKFRLNTSRQAVSMAISSATTLVNRVPRGSGYEYRIMGPGEEYLAHLGSEQKSTQSASPGRARKRRRNPSTKASKSTAERKVGGTKSARPGPKQMLESLIAENFFDSPRDIAQIIEHVRTRYARTYKATDLSPTLVRLRREDKLDRTKNEKGIYEYVVHQ